MAIKLYGNDHSPWVQAIMLGLHQKELGYTRTTVPPIEVLKQWGIMMPAASIDGEPWAIESTELLPRIGFSEVSREDIAAIHRAWGGVLHRAEFIARFWGEFSLAGDPHPALLPRLVNNFLRTFTNFFFFLLIRWGVLMGGYRDPENFGDLYLGWEERFAAMPGRFLAGDEPDSVDLLLFGIIQCHCSNPVPTVYALQADPRLTRTREWIGAMQAYFADYAWLYSGVYFAPHRKGPKPAASMDQLAFWLGAFTMIVCFPITVPLIAWLAYRARALRGQAPYQD